MNWDAVGAVAELLSAIGVIATLFYLAVQVRHGKNATEANTRSLEDARKFAEVELHRSTVLLTAPLQEWIAKDEGLAKIMIEGFEDYQGLSKIDRFRFDGTMSAYVLGFKGVIEAYNRGLMDVHTYTIWLTAVATIVKTAGGKTWWETGQFGFTPEVRARINEAAEKGTDYELQQVWDQSLSKNNDS